MDIENHAGDLVATVVLLLTASAAVDDLIRRRITNALLLVFLLPTLAFETWSFGFPWLLKALVGGVLVSAILFPFFLIRALGAGDIKLYATIAMLMGLQMTGWIFVYSLYAGGAIGAFILLTSWLKRGTWFRRTVVYATNDLASKISNADDFRKPGHLYLPFGLPIWIGTLTVSILSGHLDYVMVMTHGINPV